MDESIYSLIPDAYHPEGRPARHKSKFQNRGGTVPSYSTFPPKLAVGEGTGAAMFRGAGASIGRDVGHEINPKKYLKKQTGNLIPPPPTSKFIRPVTEVTALQKPGVPARTEKPVMGLVSDKNFVLSNAVEAVVTAPKRVKQDEALAVHGPNFGRVPKYLEKKKQALEDETHMRDAYASYMKEEEEKQKSAYYHAMGDEEKEDLVTRLKERWEEKHKMYQALPFARDTAMQIARKEALEKEMKSLESALEKLNKKVLYVYNDDPRVSGWAKGQAMQAAQSASLRK